MIRKQFFRFTLIGAINTLMMLTIYELVNLYFVYTFAFTLAYASGILFSYFFNVKYTFKTSLSWGTLAVFTLFYLASYLCGLGLSYVGVEHLGIDDRIIVLFVLPIMYPINFFGFRTILFRGNFSPWDRSR